MEDRTDNILLIESWTENLLLVVPFPLESRFLSAFGKHEMNVLSSAMISNTISVRSGPFRALGSRKKPHHNNAVYFIFSCLPS